MRTIFDRYIRFAVGWLVATALVLISTAYAGEPEAPAADALSQAVAGLGAETFEAREKAYEALLQAGEPAVEPLRKAIKDSQDTEVRERAMRLLGYLTSDAVNGLRVTLACDTATLKPGAKLRFTIRLLNLTEGELKVPLHAETGGGSELESGRAFGWSPEAGGEGGVAHVLTNDPPLEETRSISIPKGGAREVNAEATFTPGRPGAKGSAEGKLCALTFGKDGVFVLEVPASGTVAVYVSLGKPTPEGEPEPKLKEGVWSGVAYSNQVRLKLRQDIVGTKP